MSRHSNRHPNENDPTRGRKLRVERLEERAMLAGDLELVKDINTVAIGGASPANLVVVGSTLFFTANDGVTGVELWKSDGTDAGTARVKDILSGIASSSPSELVNIGGTLYFKANDGVTGIELWKSDGTEAGTVQVSDIFVGAASSSPRELTDVSGTLFFYASDAVAGEELWRSNGTAAGTFRVKDIRPGQLPSGTYLTELVNVGGTLYFNANDGVTGAELWKSDGTTLGTVLVQDIFAGANTGKPRQLTNVGGMLFFIAEAPSSGREVWTSDGTSAGTRFVRETVGGSQGSNINYLTNVGGKLFFTATADGGLELWKSDGTFAGTSIVKDIFPGNGGSLPDNLTAVGDILYFRANDGATAAELWRSDGTEAGTSRVKDIRPGSFGSNPRNLVNVGGTLFFVANDVVTGYELWKSDGTEAGTVRVKDIRPGGADTQLYSLTNFAGTLYFGALDNAGSANLWKSDGTAGGTGPVSSSVANPMTASSNPQSLTEVGPVLFFVLNDGTNPPALWRSNGTAAGTMALRTFDLGGEPRNMTNVNGRLFFTSNNSATGEEMWTSDGTASGTRLVKDILPGAASSTPLRLLSFKGLLYFSANDGVSGEAIWKSDGTEAGTTIAIDLSTGSDVNFVSRFTQVNDSLYFFAQTATGFGLWKSDGASAGTMLVKGGGAFLSADYPVDVNGTLFFRAFQTSTGIELWKSDGTEAGTVLVRDIFQGLESSLPQNLVSSGGLLFFRANGDELWKSDGTFVGTSALMEGLNNFTQLVNVGSQVFFKASTIFYGEELWKSDGTAQGTHIVKDIRSGFYSGSPHYLTNIGGTLYFGAYTADNETELWKSDGSEAGTVPIRLPSGQFLESPKSLVEINQRLFVSGVRDDVGAELFVFTLTGDYDRNGIVDPADYTLWATSFNASQFPEAAADGNHDRAIDAADYTLWRDHLGVFIDDHGGPDTPTHLAGPQAVEGTIFVPQDADWFSVNLTAGYEYRFRLKLDTLTSGGLRMYGPDGVTLLASDLDGGAAVVDWRPTTPGSYLVEVVGVGGATGTYAIDFVRDDHAAGVATTSSIAVPGSATGELWSATDADWFRVTAGGGFEYRAQLMLDTLTSGSLRVYGPDGFTVLAADVDGGAAVLHWTAASNGDYYVEVLGMGDARGTYTVTVARDDRAQGASAASVSVPSTTTAEIWSATDADWFALTASAGVEYRAQLTLSGLTSGALRAFGPDGVTLLANDIDGGEATVFWTPTTTGVYFVEVSGIAGAVGTYSLAVARDDHGSGASAATVFSTPYAATGEIWNPTDTDWFRFTAFVGAEYRAQLTSSGLANGSLRIYGLDGVTLITSDASTGNPAVVWTPTIFGTYYLEVSGVGGATGAYRLTVDQDNQNDSASGATLISSSSTLPGIIGTATDKDWFRVSASSNLEYRVQLNLFGLLSGGLKIYAPDAQLVVASDLDGGAAELILATTLSGNYYVEVTGVGGATGAYSLTINPEDHGAVGSRATFVSSSSTTAGLIGPVGDSDWIRFQPSSQGAEFRTQLNLNSLRSGGLRVYAPDGVTLVASDVDGGSAVLIWTTSLIGTYYYVEIVGIGGATGSYSLVLAREDHGSVPARATSVAIPSTTTGLIGAATDADWFRFTATAGVNYRLTLALNLLTSGTLRIFDANGTTVLASDVDGGAATLDFTPATTGTYYAEVAGFNGAVGTYTLGLALGPPSTAAIAVATAAVSAIQPAPSVAAAIETETPLRSRRELLTRANSSAYEPPERICFVEPAETAPLKTRLSIAAARDEVFALLGLGEARGLSRRLRQLRS